MPAFSNPIDIINRALQQVGSSRRLLTDVQKNISEGAFAYDKLREQELNRNTWAFATKRTILRSIGVDTLLWTPPAWSAATWSVGSIASYTPSSGVYNGEANYWQATAAKTSANVTTPDVDPDWHQYFGPVAVDLYGSPSTSQITSYHAGEIVIMPAVWSGATTYAANDTAVGSDNAIYVSLKAANFNHNPVGDTTGNWTAWASNGRSTTTWGETAAGTFLPLTYPGTTRFYLSLVDGNVDNPLTAGARWLSLTGTGTALDVLYPIGAGPSVDIGTANAYKLPYGYMRRAASDPKRGVNPYLGAPQGPIADDWLLEGGYIVSRQRGPLMVRFVANVLDVPAMNAMFCEGLAIRLAVDGLVDSLTQSAEKRGELRVDYNRILGDARVINAIESGWQDPPEDDFITARA